jgi:hypothetical protein
MKIAAALYELMIVAVLLLPTMPLFSKYGWKAFGLLFGEID